MDPSEAPLFIYSHYFRGKMKFRAEEQPDMNLIYLFGLCRSVSLMGPFIKLLFSFFALVDFAAYNTFNCIKL